MIKIEGNSRGRAQQVGGAGLKGLAGNRDGARGKSGWRAVVLQDASSGRRRHRQQPTRGSRSPGRTREHSLAVRAARRGASGVRRASGELGARAAARYWRVRGLASRTAPGERHAGRQKARREWWERRPAVRAASNGIGTNGGRRRARRPKALRERQPRAPGKLREQRSERSKHQWRPTSRAAVNGASCKQGAAGAANMARREQNKRRQTARARDRAAGRRPTGLARPRAEAAGRRPTGRARQRARAAGR
ncbi:hypothetical protein AXF42_Ash015902 [Apostasia shenzhenica]|uniref:Uncharacterized protein n=1 Tax=Apostasia shenzhenica TaxID=1088818 RepID=A0A2I0AWC5_9ASPA|nr:hypothetical protein AXF42_Ash015902 [Apostasia shenzhenica]